MCGGLSTWSPPSACLGHTHHRDPAYRPQVQDGVRAAQRCPRCTTPRGPRAPSRSLCRTAKLLWANIPARRLCSPGISPELRDPCEEQCCWNQGPWGLRQPRFLSLLSCLLGTQGGGRAGRLWDVQWGGQGGQCTGGRLLTCLPRPPGGHRAALLHTLHHAVDRRDRQEHLQAGDQEGPTLPRPRPATVLPAAPAQVPPIPQAPGVLHLMLGSRRSGSQGNLGP